jgi:D-3-phosphoglycerate dehydrogenase / 2-oxoglutarate reductase
MRILFADANHSVLHETLIAAGHSCDLFWDLPGDELIKILPLYEGLVIRSKFTITRQIIDSCPALKCIGRVGAGMENIDVAHAVSKGISCLSAPEGNRDALGEHALGMLLMLLNNLKKADEEVRKGVWLRAENRGHEITGKTIGIIGYGNMGSSFAKKLMGFDCRILAYDKYKDGFGDEYVSESAMEDLYRHCDIVSLHLPLTPETQYFADLDFIKRFHKNIYLINTARGKCLNTAHLVAALETGKVSGACLDVLEYESASFEQIQNDDLPAPLKYLLNSNRVVLTPHIGGWTYESNYKMSKVIAEKMLGVLRTS